MSRPAVMRTLFYALIVLLLAVGTGVDAASLKTCKQICGQSIEAGCVGLRKGKLKKCRKRIWKACKRGKTDCVVVTSTTATTATTLPPTTSTILATTTTVTTTTETSTTSTTLGPDDIGFRGVWDARLTAVTNGCSLGVNDDVLEVHGTAEEATATLERASGGAPLTGQVDGTGNLLLALDVLGDPGCVNELRLRMLGPVDVSDDMTTGEVRITRRGCDDPDCETVFAVSYDRR